ncbi:hypothetical protein M4951_05875 [Blastopirellula sp. J2-11]|uniref:hypothetical protein n=1 Tax=Blastopirellula sp. J2-11 TaxID=2943192 RepID=UPI0021C95C6E|nr:hypothetical protein [Blastopirellula sp. J2-11]UUO07838.1 hypothetical protein M4951_05875 [Blastopirellula sp. J2-11]
MVQCQAILVESLTAQGEWSSVHAAEYLIHLDEKSPVLSAFLPQADCKTPQYRIGVWRVLAQAEETPDSQKLYVQRIRDVLLDLAAEDRLHALESLAKLNAPITSAAELQIVEQFADSPDYSGRSFAIWRLLQKNSTLELVQSLLSELESSDQVRRLRAAFVLGQLNDLPQPIQAKLQSTFAKEPRDSIVFPYLAIAGGEDTLVRLATAENLAHRALALQELTRRRIEFEFDFASNPIDQSPLAYRQAAALALLAEQRKSGVQQNP